MTRTQLRLPVLLSLVLATANPIVAHALDECPAASLGFEDRLAAIAAAGTCASAYDVLVACSYNASGDRSLSDQVIAMCEKVFLPRIDKQRRAEYGRARKACTTRHARVSGSMQVSAIAICEAGVAVRFLTAIVAQ
jgi:hypothetical protein